MNNSASRGDTVGLLGATDSAPSLFGQTMGYVAITAGFFALGAFLGRTMSSGWGLVCFIAAWGCLIGMRLAVQRSSLMPIGLLFGVGLFLGLGTAPTLAYYASVDPQVIWLSAGATALFMAGVGAAGYGSSRDLSGLARFSSWALVALIVFGIVTIFAQIPNGSLIYSVAALVIFAGLTMFDFQRLRTSSNVDSAPVMAASIFLDGLNVFVSFLSVFDRRR